MLDDFSLEITGKDAPALHEAAHLLPAGTPVNVTYLGNEEASAREGAVTAAISLGLQPIPHIPARRLTSSTEFEQSLRRLQEAGASSQLFLVGGDPSVPHGPYSDSLSLIRSDLLSKYGVRSVGIAGYPEGHPNIPTEVLWSALMEKVSALKERSIEATIFTQFGFDASATAAWIRDIRARGVTAPIRVGVAGPVGAKRLLGYARRFGVASSAGIVQKYGLSLTNLLKPVGPEAYVTQLVEELESADTGDVRLHFYTFGSVRATAEWVKERTS